MLSRRSFNRLPPLAVPLLLAALPGCMTDGDSTDSNGSSPTLQSEDHTGAIQAINATLDDWHRAAAAADEPRYFAHFAPDAIFMGTDATEHWTADEFRVWAKPYFDRGKAWSFTPHDRTLFLSPDARTAWFDEMLRTPNLGPCRGSGVLVLRDDTWKIAQYNLSIPIPNPLADRVVDLIKEHQAAPEPQPGP